MMVIFQYNIYPNNIAVQYSPKSSYRRDNKEFPGNNIKYSLGLNKINSFMRENWLKMY